MMFSFLGKRQVKESFAIVLEFKTFFPNVTPMDNFCTFHSVHCVYFKYDNMESYRIAIHSDKTSHMACGDIMEQ